MSKKRRYHQFCSLARALDLVGERWTFLIVRDLIAGPKRYRDLLAGLPGIGTNLLATRLKELEEAGLVMQTTLPPPNSVRAYQLTALGSGLEETLVALARWGAPLLAEPQGKDLWSPNWNAVALKARFQAERVEQDEFYNLEIGSYPQYLMIKDKTLSIHEGRVPHGALFLKANSDIFLAVFVTGTLTLAQELASGALILEGDPAAFQRFLKIFAED